MDVSCLGTLTSSKCIYGMATQDAYTSEPWITVKRGPPRARNRAIHVPLVRPSIDHPARGGADVHKGEGGASSARPTRRQRPPATASIAFPFATGPVAREMPPREVTVHVERVCGAYRSAVETAGPAAAEQRVQSERSAHLQTRCRRLASWQTIRLVRVDNIAELQAAPWSCSERHGACAQAR